MERLAIALELKLAGDPMVGAIEGYGAVFGNKDSHGDVIAPGAFGKSLAERKSAGRGLPSMFMQHGAAMGADPRPVGVWTSMEEDSRGLKVSGQLSGLDTETGRYNLALIRDGAMRGLSIGYRVPPGGASFGDGKSTPRRTLSAVDLLETSIVSDPSNALAMLSSLKASEANKTIRDFEDWLREAGGYSNAQAKAIASSGFKAADPRDEDEADLLARLRRNIATISQG